MYSYQHTVQVHGGEIVQRIMEYALYVGLILLCVYVLVSVSSGVKVSDTNSCRVLVYTACNDSCGYRSPPFYRKSDAVAAEEAVAAAVD